MKRDVSLLGPVLILGMYTVLFSTPAQKHITPQIYFLFASIIFILATKLKLKDIYFSWPTSHHAWSWAFAVALLPFAFFVLVGIFQPSQTRTCYSPKWFNLLVLAPIAEEFFFRGLLLRGLTHRFSTKCAIILGSIIFMLAHGLWAFGPLCLGLFTGWLTLRYRSLLPGIVFHAIANTYMPVACRYYEKIFYFLKPWIYLRDLF